MSRLKGTKNKKKRSPRLKLPPSTVAILTKLSEDSGLPFLKVLDDSVIEGAAELRIETYNGLIDFNLTRRGKVIRERELTQASQGDQAPTLDEDTGADPAGPPDVRLERGYEPAPAPDNGVAEGPSQQEFRERAIATAEHIQNHPPFSLEGFSIPRDDTQGDEEEGEEEEVG